MKNKTLVKKIQELSQDWINEVESLGNECAYTDRIMEDIIATTKKLEGNYNKFFNINKKVD